MRFTALPCLLFALLLTASGFAQQWNQTNLVPIGNRHDDVYFLNADTGWAVNGGGHIYRTDDGGDSWTQQYVDSDTYFRSVEFIDENIGVAGSLDSVLLRTTDGGQTWSPIQQLIPTPIPGICGWSHAGDHLFGVGYFGYPAYFIKSTDQGQTWTYQDLSSLADGLVECHFLNEDLGFIGGIHEDSGAVVLKTTDGGDTWSKVFYGQNGASYIWKLDFVNSQVAYGAIEAFGGPTEVVKSTDGGNTWSVLQVSAQQLDIQGIGFIDENTGWVGPRQDPMYETTDGGQTWTALAGFPNVNRFFRVNPYLMYASGSTVYKYDNTPPVSTGETVPTLLHTLSPTAPNPFSDRATVTVSISTETFARIDLFDVLGRSVQHIHSGRLAKGEYRFPLPSQSVASLPVGIYHLVLRTSEGFLTTPCVKADAGHSSLD